MSQHERTETDEQIAKRLQNGEREALDRLAARHYDGLIGFLYRMTNGDRALAQDLAQETFLRALRHIAQYRPDLRFKPWLYAIATHLARNHYASAHVRRASAADADDLPAPDPFEPLTADDDARRVIEALSALPAHQREVVTLFYYQSFSYADIAATLALPIGTVKSRLSLAIKRLRAALKEENGEIAR